MKRVYQIDSLAALQDFAKALLHSLPLEVEGAYCIALHGELGAGKTAFVKTLGHLLGATEEITSPTFVVMRSYPLAHSRFDRLVHMDAYRLESNREVEPLHLDEIVADPKTLLCIEWPEQLGDRLPAKCLHLFIEITEGEARRIELVDDWSQ